MKYKLTMIIKGKKYVRESNRVKEIRGIVKRLIEKYPYDCCYWTEGIDLTKKKIKAKKIPKKIEELKLL